MNFTLQGKSYRLEFQRKFENVTLHSRGANVKQTRSKYPFTSAILLEVKPGIAPITINKAKVGCLPTDSFSNERGRLEALKLLSKNLRKQLPKETAVELNSKIWNAYMTRGNKPPVTPATPIALPASSLETAPIPDALTNYIM